MAGSGPIELRDHARDMIIAKLNQRLPIKVCCTFHINVVIFAKYTLQHSVASELTLEVNFVNDSCDQLVLKFIETYLSECLLSIGDPRNSKRKRNNLGQQQIQLNKTMVLR